MKGSPFNIAIFEQLINCFEKENSATYEVKPFSCFKDAIEKLQLSQSIEDIEKIYEVMHSLIQYYLVLETIEGIKRRQIIA